MAYTSPRRKLIFASPRRLLQLPFVCTPRTCEELPEFLLIVIRTSSIPHNRVPLLAPRMRLIRAKSSPLLIKVMTCGVLTSRIYQESHDSVRSQVCCGRARQRTMTSANLRLPFAMERFSSNLECCASASGPLAWAS